MQGPDFDDDLNWYAVLEGAHPYYDTLGLIYAHIPVPEWLPIYQFGPYTALAKAGPVLLKLNQPDHWINHWQASFPDLAGSLIGSGQDLARVGNHLRTLVSVHVEGGTEALFRFHDSWITSALYPTLEEAERARIHGPIDKWLWLRGDKIKIGERPGEHSPASEPLEDGWLQLDKIKQNAISEGLAAKRNWKEAQQ